MTDLHGSEPCRLREELGSRKRNRRGGQDVAAVTFLHEDDGAQFCADPFTIPPI
jgi:hypothetical protein